MTTYNTGNPIGSKDPRDLYDNAENLDEAVNTRQAESWDDRFGVARKTWWGMEQDFQQFLLDSGYVGLGPNGEIQDYAPGLEITARNQVFRYDGELYRAGAVLELPYTTTGDWGAEEGLFVAVGDQSLRQELADPDNGADMVAYGTTSVADALDFSTASIQSIVDLRAVLPDIRTNPNPVITVSCHTIDGDGGGGRFVWEPNSTEEDDNGTVIGTSAIGRWTRIIEGPVYAEWFGARAFTPSVDDPTEFDSTSAFQAASDFAGLGGAWLWRGVHRVTDTVRIPRRQSFGSFGISRSFSPGDLSSWQGPNTAQQNKLDSSVFFDPPTKSGVLFECEEDATPHDFTAYSIGFVDIGSDVTLSQPETNHYHVHAFRLNKYINLSRVAVNLFHTAFLSEGFEGEQGNYYSVYENFEVNRCFRAFKYDSIQPFNQRLIAPKIGTVSQFMDCEHGMSNMSIHGGSIEGWRQPSNIRGAGNLAIFGTYFETFQTAATGSIFYLNSNGNYFNFTYSGGMCYLNNTEGMILSEKINTTINSNGNVFLYAGEALTPRKFIYRPNTTAQPTFRVMSMGDSYSGTANSFVFTNVTTGVFTDPPGASALAGFLNFGELSLRMAAHASEPTNRISGALYLANGGSWNPLARSGGYPYFVCYRNGWEAL